VILYFIQYQGHNFNTFDKKQMALLTKISRAQKVLQSLSSSYDTFGLAKMLAKSYIHGKEEIDVKPLFKSLLENLKNVFTVVEITIFEAIEDEQK
jgi:hypothetical protein